MQNLFIYIGLYFIHHHIYLFVKCVFKTQQFVHTKIELMNEHTISITKLLGAKFMIWFLHQCCLILWNESRVWIPN